MRTTRRMLPALLAAGALAATVAGCGPAASQNSDSAKEFKGAQAEVAKVVDELEAAATKRDGKKICAELLAPALLQTFTADKTVCKDVLDDNLGDADTFSMKVTSVQVDGTTATAVVESDAGKGEAKQKSTFTFTKGAGTNGAWKISSFGS